MIAVRSSLTIPILAVAVFAATLGWFGYRHLRRDPAAAGPAVAAPAPGSAIPGRPEPKPADPPTQTASAPPIATLPATAAPPSIRALPEAPVGPAGSVLQSAAAPDPATPAFDVVRVEPSGESVIAGRAPAGTTVALLVDGRPHAETVADPSGHFALVPTPMPVGSHELVLRATAPGASGAVSAQSVTIVIAENRRDAPLVSVMTPGQPAVVLSRPEAPARVASVDPASPIPARPPVAAGTPQGEARSDPAVSTIPPSDRSPSRRPEPARASSPASTRAASNGPTSANRPGAKPSLEIVSVETEGTGRLYVSGTATPSATVRLYLNDTFIAPGSAGPDGRIAFSIERGIRPGSYRVRLDEVDPASGAVRSRAEVPFAMPVEVAAAGSGRAAAGVGPVPTAPGPAAEVSAGGREADPGRTAARTPAGPVGGPPPQSDSTTAGIQVSPGRATPVGAATVVVPEVNTATVSRGESLWEISRRTYGEGLRYTVIYGANSGQIRDPNLIYPGQIFVLPSSIRQGALR